MTHHIFDCVFVNTSFFGSGDKVCTSVMWTVFRIKIQLSPDSSETFLVSVIGEHYIFAVTFDEGFGRAIGVKVSFYNTMLAISTAVTIVLGMQMIGAMLISSLIIFPALTSMRLFHSFRGVVITSGVLSVACFVAGMVLSYQSSMPAGASVVLANLGAFLVFFAVGKIKELV